MYTVLAYLVTLIVIVIAVFTTLFIKSELERVFSEKKDVIPFHICNVIVILMASFVTHAVMTLYVIRNEFNWLLQLILLLFLILPIYILGHLAFNKYKQMNRKYVTTENRKVIILNEEQLGKKRHAIFKSYNAGAKENTRTIKKKRLPHR